MSYFCSEGIQCAGVETSYFHSLILCVSQVDLLGSSGLSCGPVEVHPVILHRVQADQVIREVCQPVQQHRGLGHLRECATHSCQDILHYLMRVLDNRRQRQGDGAQQSTWSLHQS